VGTLACAGGAAASAPCERPGLQTVRESTHARVLQKPGRYDESLYGCLFDRDRLVRLDRSDVPETLYRFRLAGHFVGFAAEGVDGASSYVSVVAQNLRTGSVARSAPVVDEDDGHLAELRVTSRGWLVWVACGASRCGRAGERQLYRYDSRGIELLDRGALIHKHSLRMYRGARVSWRHGDEIRTATLR
jgi:hypothetical protein